MLDRILEVTAEILPQLGITQQFKDLVGESLLVAWGYHPHTLR